MTTASNPELNAGKVYRTRDFKAWSANPPRLVKRLVEEGRLTKLAHGMFLSPRQSRFGTVPPDDEALMRAFLRESSFVFTGSEQWNALGLGTTAVHAVSLVYNRKRSGSFTLGGRTFTLRRVGFPDNPTREWFAIDLLENVEQAASSRADLEGPLAKAIARGELNADLLSDMAEQFGSKATQSVVLTAVERASARKEGRRASEAGHSRAHA